MSPVIQTTCKIAVLLTPTQQDEFHRQLSCWSHAERLMKWLDPVDCQVARNHLEHGHAFEAARLLLNSPHRAHRAARTMLPEIGDRLVDLAGEAKHAGDIETAWEMIETAGKCVTLQGEAAVLRNTIRTQKEEHIQQEQWHKNRIGQARILAKEGNLRSALELLDQASGRPDSERLRRDLEQRLLRFERNLHECRELLEHGDEIAARKQLDKARAINSADPALSRLEKSLPDTMTNPKASPGMRTPPSQPLQDRRTSFAVADHSLIVSLPEIVLGNLRGESVQVPIQARIHRRHALIIRDRQRYRVRPFDDCNICVNGEAVGQDRELADGDVVQFENKYCEWSFRRPVADSTTAVLEQVTPGGSSIRTPDGSQFRRVVLADDDIHIRRKQPAHLVVPHLPCESLVLTWTADGWVARAEGATVSVNGDVSTNVVQVPSCLEISADIDEAERIGRLFLGDDGLDDLRLPVFNPFP